MMKFANDWYGRMEDLEEAIREEGYEILDANREYIDFVNPESDDDTQYVAHLGGTERTITVERVEEV